MSEKFKAKVVMLKGEPGASGDYNGQINKPQINGQTLIGNKTAAQLGLATAAQITNLSNRISQVVANDSASYAGIDMRIYTSDPARMTWDDNLNTYKVAATFNNLPAGYVILEASWAYLTENTYTWSRDGLSVWAHSTSVSMRITNNMSQAYSYVLRLVIAVSEEVALSELTDLRTGVDGTVYQTAGDAVRGQLEDLQNQTDELSTSLQDLNTLYQNIRRRVSELEDVQPQVVNVTGTLNESGTLQNAVANRSYEFLNEAFWKNAHIYAQINDLPYMLTLCDYLDGEDTGYYSFKYDWAPDPAYPNLKIFATVTIGMDGSVSGKYVDTLHK